MEYKVVFVKAISLLGTNFEAAAEKLSREVNDLIAGGWEPQGGISYGHTFSTKAPYLFQAMVKRR